MLVASEDARRHRFLAGCSSASRDVIELEAVEFVLQPADFLAVCSHLGIVVHDLVDDQLGISSNIEVSDAQLDGNA